MAGKASDKMKLAAQLRAQRYLEKDPEHFAKMAAKSANKKAPKRGLAALKESDPKKFKEITSMGGKNRWNASTKRKAQKARSDDLKRKVKHQRQQELEKLRKFDERDGAPKAVKKPRPPKLQQPKLHDEEDTGW